MKWVRIFFLWVLLCCVLVSYSGSALAQAEYRITEPELTRLEQIFNQLESNNRQLLNDLETSRQDLTTAQQRLVSYQQELELLQKQLLALKAESTKARSDLEQANNLLRRAVESCKQLEKEEQSLKMQRNISVLAAVLIVLRQ